MTWPWRRHGDRRDAAEAQDAVIAATRSLGRVEQRTPQIVALVERSRAAAEAARRTDALDRQLRDSLGGGHPR